jgi:hypothetical protein
VLPKSGYQPESDVDRFIFDEIETVPHLEALLLVWNSRPQPWSEDNLAHRLYISVQDVRTLLADLILRNLVVKVPGSPDGYRYESSGADKDQLMDAVDAAYRRELVRLSKLIHSKPSSSIRAFAKAFRLTKEPE